MIKKRVIEYVPSLPLWCLILLAGMLRIHHLNFKSVSIDESIGFFYAIEPLYRIIILTINDVHPPLFYLTHHFWIELFGRGEAAIRAISVVFGVLSLAMTYKLGKLVFNKWVGLSAAFLMAVSPWHIWICQNARSNSMLLFLVLVSIYSFYHLVFNGQRRWYYIYAMATLLSIYTHYFAFMIWFTQMLFFLLYFPTLTSRVRLFWRTQLTIVLAYSLWLPFMISQFITKSRPTYKDFTFSFLKNLFDFMNPYVAVQNGLNTYAGEIIFIFLFVWGILAFIRKSKTAIFPNRSVDLYDYQESRWARTISMAAISAIIGNLFLFFYFTPMRTMPILGKQIEQNIAGIYANTIRYYHIDQLNSFPLSFLISTAILVSILLCHLKLNVVLDHVYSTRARMSRIFSGMTRDGIRVPPTMSFILTHLILPPILAGVISLKSPYLLLRNMVIILPAYYLIIGYAIFVMPKRTMQVALLSIIFILGSGSFIFFEDWNRKDDWRSAANTVKAFMKDDEFILLDHLFGKKPFYYYGLKTKTPINREQAPRFLDHYHSDFWLLASYHGEWSAEEFLNDHFTRLYEWDFIGNTNPDDLHPNKGIIRVIYYKNHQLDQTQEVSLIRRLQSYPQRQADCSTSEEKRNLTTPLISSSRR
jgi:uncharacterized membrane protein